MVGGHARSAALRQAPNQVAAVQLICPRRERPQKPLPGRRRQPSTREGIHLARGALALVALVACGTAQTKQTQTPERPQPEWAWKKPAPAVPRGPAGWCHRWRPAPLSLTVCLKEQTECDRARDEAVVRDGAEWSNCEPVSEIFCFSGVDHSHAEAPDLIVTACSMTAEQCNSMRDGALIRSAWTDVAQCTRVGRPGE